MMEGGAVTSAVGFLLSGETATAVVSAAGLVALVLSGPRRLTPSTIEVGNLYSMYCGGLARTAYRAGSC
jgi:hypothetical protein